MSSVANPLKAFVLSNMSPRTGARRRTHRCSRFSPVWPPIRLHTVRSMSRLPLALGIAAAALAVPATAQAAYTVGPGPDVLLSSADQLTYDATCTLAQARYAN